MGEGGGEASSCCNEPQIAFCALYLGYLAFVFLTWRTSLVKPMRLIAVFLHEISHAIACWLTCGDVRGIEVYNNEGGVTKYIGGCRLFIIPAGYIGAAFWGMVFVVLSGGRRTATFAASVLIFMLLVSLCYSPNRVMVYLNLGWAALTLAFIFVEWFYFSPVLTFLILFYGVFIGTYAICDIFDDLIHRTVKGSDAYACYEIAPCCLPRCVGVQWALVATFLQFFGVWVAMVMLSDECEEKSWSECASGNLPTLENDVMFWRDWDWLDQGR